METTRKILENLESVRARIAGAAKKAARNPDDVLLVGVTKYVDSLVAKELVLAGCHHLGESRPQQLWKKGDDLKDLDIHWHLIGHLQRNKVERTLRYRPTIHAIDSLRLLEQIEKDAKAQNITVKALLEVNVTQDSSKTGLSLLDAHKLLEFYSSRSAPSNVQLVGLMGMSSLSGCPDDVRREFSTIREASQKWSREFGIGLNQLSMGMSDDFEIAVEEGSTMVRIGSKLFE